MRPLAISMRNALLAAVAVAALILAPMPAASAASAPQQSASHKSTTKKKKSSHHRHSSRREPFQKAPTPDRISEIQSALARGGYYEGDPNGKWDSSTVAAMSKFQSANGLNSSGKIDAITLQKLGLGSSTAGVDAPRPPKPADPASNATAQPAKAVASNAAPAAAASPAPATTTTKTPQP